MNYAVFVPAVMSVGLLFSIASLLDDLFRWGSRRARERRVRLESATVARTTIDPTSPLSDDETIRPPRIAYLLWAMAFLGGACYVAVGSTANYLRAGGYVSDIAWLLAVSLVLAAGIGFLGGVVAVVYLTWPSRPAGTHRVLRRLPFVASMSSAESTPSPATTLFIGVAGTAAALLSLLVGSNESLTVRIDEPLADWFVNQDGLAALRYLDPLGRTEVAVALVALVGIAALRCRILAAAYPTAVALGGLASLVLKAIVERPRPPTSALHGSVDSFPSGHVIQVVLIAGLLPLGLAVLTGRRRVVLPATLLLGLGALGSSVHRIRSGEHWPLDALAGALIGLTVVLAIRWAVDHVGWHRRCRACVWSAGPHRLREQRGAFVISPRAARRLERVGQMWSLAAVTTLLVLLWRVGLPVNPEAEGFGSTIETPGQLALLGLFSIGAFVALRFAAVGAVMIALAGIGMGTFAAVQYEPQVAVAIAAAFLVPPVLLWLSWQRRHRWSTITALAAVTAVALSASWAGAVQIHDHYFGPTHPASTAIVLPVDRVEWAWSGGLTSTAVEVVARLPEGADEARLVTTDSSGLTRRSSPATPDDHGVVRLAAVGLTPGSAHSYVIEVDGRADAGRGQGSFRTPAQGATSMRIAVGSCARTGSNGAVFDQILAQEPLLYLEVGDIHYRNIDSASPSRFRFAYEDLLDQPGQAALYREVPIAHVWDDHDFGPNDADSSSPTTATVQAVYRQLVPHYPLPAGETGPVYQAFTLGRVRVVISDTRSARTDETMLGAEQLDWLLHELRTASRSHALVVWASPTPWIGPAEPGSDLWGGWDHERSTIARAIAEAGIDNLVMVSGDAHMVAIDDGTNSDYAPSGGAGFPVLHAAALDRPGNVKGGPYSEGSFPGGGQFGLIDIVDEGTDEITVTLRGMDWRGTELVSLTRIFEVDVD